MLSKRVLVGALALKVAFACAEAQDDSNNSSSGNTDEGGKSSGGQGGVAGKLTSAGTTGVSQGATSTSGGAGTSGSGSGGKSGSGGASGSANGGNASGGRAGSGSGGTNGGSSSAGTSSAGTSAGGTASAGTGPTGLACVEEPVPDPGAGGAGSGGAGGAPDVGAAANLFFDDFESGVSKWTTTLGTWALIADGSQAFEQSVQENKLQIGIANGLCAADQVIDAKLKVVAFKGQSNSYVAALFGRALSPTTHYLLALGSDGKLALRKRINSTSTGATAIGSAVTMSISVGQWYDVHFELIGTSLKGCIGAVCVTGTDSSIASGSVGVGTVNTSARFDDVKLTTP